MIRLALLGFWHVHATEYAAEAQANPDTEIVATWDDDVARGVAGARQLGVPFEADLARLLARFDVDGVIVTTKTSAHPDVLGAAIAAGKHVYTEKVLALSPADARGIVDAVERAGVVLTVSLPRLSHGYTLAIREILASGVLGQVTQVRVRLSHDGAVGRRWLPARFFDATEAGGGALVDLGCHPLYLARLFLGGMPATVTAEYGRITAQGVEDNAVAILRHRSGALGIAETGFVNPSSPFTIEIHGTAGSLLYGTPEPQLLVRTPTAGADDTPAAWEERPVPGDGPTPFEQWVMHIKDGTRATENIALAVDLTTLVAAADRAALTGRSVTIEIAAGSTSGS